MLSKNVCYFGLEMHLMCFDVMNGTSAGEFTVNVLTCLIYIIEVNTLEVYMRITFTKCMSGNKGDEV